ncbi:MAG: winged helix-turn-helix transcriptional regulator [Candidatus Thorarchaeota archaeon]|nr:MAG: winged helix-turn-helix transcriptional regulator [Candidatus Thorarchaeota archaeon]
MDSIDRGIALDLSRDCRTSLQKLSLKYNISSNAIKKRIDKLLEIGVIEKFLVRLSRAMADTEMLFAIVYTDKSVDDDTFAERVFEHPQVASVHYDSFGSCIVHAEYSGAKELGELGVFLRGLESVTDVELHTLPIARGSKVELKNLQMRVLVPLLDNPRMSVTDIAQATGLTARRVRRTIQELSDGGGVEFTVALTFPAADTTYLAFRMTWDSKIISPEQIDSIIKKQFPNDYYRSVYSAIEPIIWCDFIVGHARDAETITAKLRKIPSATVENTIIVYPPKKRRNIRELKLRKMLSDAGYLH